MSRGALPLGAARLLDRRQRLRPTAASAAIDRLASRWPNLILVHTPVHASWLNQVEIYFSVVQRKVLTPNDFDSLAALEDRLLAFQEHYQSSAKPFQWKFTRRDLASLLEKLAASSQRRPDRKYVTRISGPEY